VIDFWLLRYFWYILAAAKERPLSKAAKQLGMS